MPPLTPITYTPTFQHLDWVDNVDRVQAGGDHGFNIEFHNLEKEFASLYQTIVHADAVKTDFDTTLGQVKTQIVDIYTKLAALGTVVTAPVTLGMPPVLLPFRPNPLRQWSSVLWGSQIGGVPAGSYAELPGGQDQAQGVAPLNLPKGVKLVQLKVVGELTPAAGAAAPPILTTDLVQEPRVTPFIPTNLVTVTGFAGPVAIAGTPTYNPDANLYYIFVRISNALNATVRLRGFELVYQP